MNKELPNNPNNPSNPSDPNTIVPPVHVEGDRSEEVRLWIRENGRGILIGLVVAFGGLFGFNMWKNSQTTYHVNAAKQFEKIYQEQVKENKDQEVISSLSQALKQDFSDSVFTGFSSFVLAKEYHENGELEKAKAEYQWVIDNAQQNVLQEVAHLRLADIYYQLDEYEQALTLLASMQFTENMFVEELKGDIYKALKDYAKAKTAYENAKKYSEENDIFSQLSPLIELKLKDLPNAS